MLVAFQLIAKLPGWLEINATLDRIAAAQERRAVCDRVTPEPFQYPNSSFATSFTFSHSRSKS